MGVLGGMLTHSLSSEEGFDGRACMVGLMARVRARHAEGSLLPFILIFLWASNPLGGTADSRAGMCPILGGVSGEVEKSLMAERLRPGSGLGSAGLALRVDPGALRVWACWAGC